MEIIDGFSNYAVSWLGEVFRIKAAKGGASRSQIPYPLKPTLTGPKNYQHLSVMLRGDDGRYQRIPVHHLVIVAFRGAAPSVPQGYYEVVHLDGDRMNNRADNLTWIRRSDNPKRVRALGAGKRSAAALPLREAA